MGYKDSQITPLEFARRYLGEYRTKGREITPKQCPYCHGGKHHNRYTFAVNIDTGNFNCKRGTCGVTGNFKKLLMDFGGFMIYEQQNVKRKFKKSTAKVESKYSNILEYFKSRGISDKTVFAYGVGEDGKGNIAFPYIKDGQQVAVKFRLARKIKDGERKMWREEGTDTTTLFGMQTVSDDFPYEHILVICEGEIDAMALYESGVRNVVSVPNGSEDLNWVEANFKWLDEFKTITICGDNDEPGQEMVQKLIPKLGEWRVKAANLPKNCKDANEVLFKHGKEKLKELIDKAQDIPLESLIRMSEVKAFDIDKVKRVKSNIKPLDKELGGFMMGQVSVWTGINSSGKSTLLGQLLIETVEQELGVCAFSGELPAPLFRYWIELQMAGPHNLSKKIDQITGDNHYYISTETAAKMRSWYNDRFFLYDNMSAITPESVLKVFEYAARRYDCKVYLVDNLMTMIGGTGDDYYRRQSEFIKSVTQFAKKFDVHVHVVAHPRKVRGRVTKMDVAGTGDITNLADNVFSVHRIAPDDREDKEFKDFYDCDSILDIFKNRFSGRQEISIGMKFSEPSKRFYTPKDEAALRKEYSWTKENKGDSWEDDDKCPF
jgi:twinkle protein